MKATIKKCAAFVITHKWLWIGFVLVTVFLFSNYVCGYQLSFTNVNYNFAPFSSTGTGIDGPLLSDVADSHYPSVYAAYYDNEGLNLWESDISVGRPSGAIAFMMNPLEWLYVFPFSLAIFLKAFSEFAMAFCFMYLFMRSIGNGKFAAAMSGAIYAFSAVIVVWLGWPHSDVAALAPLLFFAIERLMATVKLRYALLISFVVFVMLMVGMPTYAAYFLYLAGVYIVIFTIKNHWHQKKNIFIVGCLFAFAVVLAALASLPYTYTLLGNVVSNGYMESRAAYAEVQLSWGYLRTFVYPYIRDGLPLHINESTLYVGIAAVVLLPLALFNNRRKKRNVFFIIASVMMFLLIFTDLLNALYTRLPMINTSLKYRVITLLMFTMAVLTGISLNDVIKNREAYRKRRWLAVPCVVLWSGAAIYAMTDGVFYGNRRTVLMVLAIAMVVIGCVTLFMFLKKHQRVMNGLLCTLMAIVILFDGATFAKGYLPWIDADASVIPEPTDSVTYLMDHTQAEERVMGVGMWTMFPNTPSYYDLNDIRSHGFEMTNSDIKSYYTMIDPAAYDTRTRVTFKTIENEALLQYLGVKYIYGNDVGELVPLVSDAGHSKVFGSFESHSTISQTLYLEETPCAFSVLLATYGNSPQSDGDLTFTLTSKTTNEIVFESSVAVKTIVDNAYVNFAVSDDTTIPPGEYILSLTVGDLQQDTITVWMKEAENSFVQCGEINVPGCMAINGVYCRGEYRIVYSGTDSMLVAQADAYANKAELVETVLAFEKQEDVLSAMSAEYMDHTAFVVADDTTLVYDQPLTAQESIEVVEYTDDYVRLTCTSEYERYVMLNDYYDEDWSVYVNGVKTEIEKVNYFMRAVRVQSGEDIVIEFRYEPHSLYLVIAVSLVTILIGILLFVFAKYPQKLIDRMTNLSDQAPAHQEGSCVQVQSDMVNQDGESPHDSD